MSNKTKYKKYFFCDMLPVYSWHELCVNKIAMKKFLKNMSLGVDFKLWVPLLMYKIKAHIISAVKR